MLCMQFLHYAKAKLRRRKHIARFVVVVVDGVSSRFLFAREGTGSFLLSDIW